MIVLCTGLWDYAQSLAPSDILSVSFLDVGQGDATYIRTPNGNDVLIDGGPTNSVLQQLQGVMPAMDRDIDLIIATHPDKDHIAGLPVVFDTYEIKTFLHTEVPSDSSLDEDLTESATYEQSAGRRMQQVFARRGQRFILDDKHGVYLDVLFPDDDTTDFKETNEASIITRLVYGEHSFLLTGDAYISNEQFLVRNDKTNLQSTVLKLGHHGSKTSTDETFLNQVKPQYAVVSAGKNNSYHHPAQAVVERVKAHNIPILSTIERGTITFQTNGEEIWIK